MQRATVGAGGVHRKGREAERSARAVRRLDALQVHGLRLPGARGPPPLIGRTGQEAASRPNNCGLLVLGCIDANYEQNPFMS